MSCGCHFFSFFFSLSPSLSISVCVAKMLRASCPTVYLFNGAVQYVVKRLDPSWWMVTGCSGLVFSMRWTVGEMDSRLWTIWLEPFDGHTVHKTVHLHTAGMTTKKSILQSRANVSPKMKNRAFPVNDTSVWNSAAYFPGFFFSLSLCGSGASDSLCINAIIGIVVGKSKLVIWGFLMRTKFATTVLNTA